MKNGKPAWPRWLMLVAALLLCWSIWDEAGVYAALTARPVFSPEETAAIAAGFRSGWAIRGLAAYRALQASTPIYLVVWAILLALEVSLPGLLVVCGGYVAGFGVYVWALVKYEREL